jgi:flavin reductase (DIM6/NTAB) family NADH-FMN oxidoreductase RutF
MLPRANRGASPYVTLDPAAIRAAGASMTSQEGSALLTTPTIEPLLFREAMSRFAAAVHLVATDGPAGRRGVTATSVVSVSDSPASLPVCLKASNAANARFAGNRCFSVNVLGRRHEHVARGFSGEGNLSPEERFGTAAWTRLATEAPILVDGLVSFDCRLVEARVVATHHVFIGEVVAVALGVPDDALLYHDRSYRHV